MEKPATVQEAAVCVVCGAGLGGPPAVRLGQASLQPCPMCSYFYTYVCGLLESIV
jgi:hypothetical protein